MHTLVCSYKQGSVLCPQIFESEINIVHRLWPQKIFSLPLWEARTEAISFFLGVPCGTTSGNRCLASLFSHPCIGRTTPDFT